MPCIVSRGVLFVVFLMISIVSCAPPKQSDGVITLSQDEFKKLTKSEKWYGYRGDGYITEGAALGTEDIVLDLWPVTVDSVRGSIKIAGYVLFEASREALPNSDVVIGTVAYKQDGSPHRIVPKKSVTSGVNGEFVINANIEDGDRLFVMQRSFVVRVYDIHKLIYSP